MPRSHWIAAWWGRELRANFVKPMSVHDRMKRARDAKAAKRPDRVQIGASSAAAIALTWESAVAVQNSFGHVGSVVHPTHWAVGPVNFFTTIAACCACFRSFVGQAGHITHTHTHTSGKCDVGASHKRIVGHDEAPEDQHGPGQLGVHPGRHWRGRKGAGQESTRTEQIVLF